MSFFQNTCKPEGLGGKFMVHSMNVGHAAMAEWGFQHFALPEAGPVLDIGCGGGANLKRLLEKVPTGKVMGIDYSEVSVEASRKLNRAAIDTGRCEVRQGNVMSLPFADSTFRAATAFETIYFWPDLGKAFKEVFRVLQTGGRFFICNESDGKNPKDEKWVKKIEGMRLYRADQLRTLLEQAGFTSIQIDENEKHWLCVSAEKAA